jgi:hypothetical protein
MRLSDSSPTSRQRAQAETSESTYGRSVRGGESEGQITIQRTSRDRKGTERGREPGSEEVRLRWGTRRALQYNTVRYALVRYLLTPTLYLFLDLQPVLYMYYSQHPYLPTFLLETVGISKGGVVHRYIPYIPYRTYRAADTNFGALRLTGCAVIGWREAEPCQLSCNAWHPVIRSQAPKASSGIIRHQIICTERAAPRNPFS